MASSSIQPPSSQNVAGIVLAAGESSRMGRDKALLPLGNKTFLLHLIETFEGVVSPLLVVLGHHRQYIQEQIGDIPGVLFLSNPDYPQGQLSSLQVALRHLKGESISGAVVCLVDHPLLSLKVIDSLLERFRESSAPIVIPTFQGRRGHPVVFNSSLFEELLNAPVDQGARVVVRRHGEELKLVEVDDGGILADIDRPGEYAELLKNWSRTSRRKPDLPEQF